MQVSRVTTSDTEEFRVGDIIVVNMKNGEDFTATAFKVTDEGTWFRFNSDIYLESIFMAYAIIENKIANLQMLLNYVLQQFPVELSLRIDNLTISEPINLPPIIATEEGFEVPTIKVRPEFLLKPLEIPLF